MTQTEETKKLNDRNNEACHLAYQKKYEEAIKIFDEILAIDPHDYKALSNKATVIGKSGRYQEARDLFEKLVAEDPHGLSNRICYINLLTYLGKYEDALECYKQMPRPGGMTYMLLGSFSDDFKMLRKIESQGRTVKEIIEQMENYRIEKRRRQTTIEFPRFISLIFSSYN